MANTEFRFIINANDKQIEDVIDARKKIGQYDIHRYPTNPVISQNSLCRSAYYVPVTGINGESRQILSDDAAVWINDDICNHSGEPGMFNIGPTDSEITVVRVKREGLQYKSDENKWNLHDDAVPGDGTHLGESPSLVNLVTLVGQSLGTSKTYEYNEYLVPLSSWDPCDNPYQMPGIFLNGYRQELDKPKLHVVNERPGRRSSLAGRITSFLRKRCTKKSKTSVTEVTPENATE